MVAMEAVPEANATASEVVIEMQWDEVCHVLSTELSSALMMIRKDFVGLVLFLSG